MAYPCATAANPGCPADPELDRRAALEEYFQTPSQERADEVGTTAVSVAIDETGPLEPDEDYTGDWREDFGDSVGISSWREL